MRGVNPLNEELYAKQTSSPSQALRFNYLRAPLPLLAHVLRNSGTVFQISPGEWWSSLRGQLTPQYPPTPALAKAGAAPGTTAGVELVFLSNRHPQATSMASYGRPSLPCARPKRFQTVTRLKPLKRFKPLKLAKAFRNAQPRRHRHSQPTGTPRPHQWLLMGVQACRLPAPKRLKRLQPLKLCKSVSERPTAQAQATPRPDPSPFCKRGPACRSPGVRSQQAPQGHINGFLWASKPAVCQPLNA